MNSRIYIASGLKNYKKVLNLRDKLLEYGIHLTYDWAEIINKNTELGIEESKDSWEEIASAEYKGVIDAQLFFLVSPAGRGGHFELGVAYAKHKPIVILETDDSIAFYDLPGMAKFTDETEALERILEIVG